MPEYSYKTKKFKHFSFTESRVSLAKADVLLADLADEVTRSDRLHPALLEGPVCPVRLDLLWSRKRAVTVGDLASHHDPDQRVPVFSVVKPKIKL